MSYFDDDLVAMLTAAARVVEQTPDPRVEPWLFDNPEQAWQGSEGWRGGDTGDENQYPWQPSPWDSQGNELPLPSDDPWMNAGYQNYVPAPGEQPQAPQPIGLSPTGSPGNYGYRASDDSPWDVQQFSSGGVIPGFASGGDIDPQALDYLSMLGAAQQGPVDPNPGRIYDQWGNWSDDGGYTWSNGYTAGQDATGQTYGPQPQSYSDPASEPWLYNSGDLSASANPAITTWQGPMQSGQEAISDWQGPQQTYSLNTDWQSPLIQPQDDNGSFWDSLGSVASGARDIGLGALDQLNSAGQSTFANLTGETEAGQHLIDPNHPELGTYRDKPDFMDMLSGLKDVVTQSPADSYSQGQQAFIDRLRNPDVQADPFGRAALETASNPLSYIGGPAGFAVNAGITLGMDQLQPLIADIPGFSDLSSGNQQLILLAAQIITLKVGTKLAEPQIASLVEAAKAAPEKFANNFKDINWDSVIDPTADPMVNPTARPSGEFAGGMAGERPPLEPLGSFDPNSDLSTPTPEPTPVTEPAALPPGVKSVEPLTREQVLRETAEANLQPTPAGPPVEFTGVNAKTEGLFGSGTGEAGVNPEMRTVADTTTAPELTLHGQWAPANDSSLSTPLKPPAPEVQSAWDKLGLSWNLPGQALRQVSVLGHFGITGLSGWNVMWHDPPAWLKMNAEGVKALHSTEDVQAARAAATGDFNNIQPGLAKDLVDNGFRGLGPKSAHTGSGELAEGDVLDRITGLGKIGLKPFERSQAFYDRVTEAYRRYFAFKQIDATRAANLDKLGIADLTPKQIKDIASNSNHLAFTVSGGNNPLINALFFAPKMLLSQAALVKDAFTQGGTPGNQLRLTLAQNALETLIGVGTVNMATSGGADIWGPGMGRTVPTDKEDLINFLKNPNLLSVKIPGSDTTLRPFGPWNATMKVTFNLIADILNQDPGQAGMDSAYFFSNKLIPLARVFAEGFIASERGKPFDWKSQSINSLYPIAKGVAESAIANAQAGNIGGLASNALDYFTNMPERKPTQYETLDAIVKDHFSKEYGDNVTFWNLSKDEKAYANMLNGGAIPTTNPVSLKAAEDSTRIRSDAAESRKVANDRYQQSIARGETPAIAGKQFRDDMVAVKLKEAAAFDEQQAEIQRLGLPQNANDRALSEYWDTYKRAQDPYNSKYDANAQQAYLAEAAKAWTTAQLAYVNNHVNSRAIDPSLTIGDPVAEDRNNELLTNMGSAGRKLYLDQQAIADSGFWTTDQSKARFLEDHGGTAGPLGTALANWGYAETTRHAVEVAESYAQGKVEAAKDFDTTGDSKAYRTKVSELNTAQYLETRGIYGAKDVSAIERVSSNPTLDAYYKFVDSTKDPLDPTSKPDWDAVAVYLAQNPDTQAALDKIVKPTLDPHEQQLKDDQKYIANHEVPGLGLSYWGLGDYYAKQFASALGLQGIKNSNDLDNTLKAYVHQSVASKFTPDQANIIEREVMDKLTGPNSKYGTVRSELDKAARVADPELAKRLARWDYWTPSKQDAARLLAGLPLQMKY